MADTNGRGSISLAGLGMVSAGVVLIWSAIYNPPGGPFAALRQIVTTGKPLAGAEAVGAAGAAAGAAASGANPGNIAGIGARSSAGSAAAAGGDAGSVIKVAESYLGDPYVWAGATHRGIDCSGLVLVAYRDGAGIKLPHLATLQAARGRRITADQVQAADLVCWGHPGNYPHIALAVDQTTCIASWTYGVGVQYGPIHQKAVAGFGYPDFYRIL